MEGNNVVEVRNIRDINLIPEQKKIITLKLLYSVYGSYRQLLKLLYSFYY